MHADAEHIDALRLLAFLNMLLTRSGAICADSDQPVSELCISSLFVNN